MNFQNTLSANKHFLGGTTTTSSSFPLSINKIIQSCYHCMTQVDSLRGQLSSDQYNYIQEHFNQIIMILSNASQNGMPMAAETNVPFSIFDHPYVRDDLSNLPVQPRFTYEENTALSVPEEYKILSSLDKQLAYTKYGEQVVVPSSIPTTVGKPDQVIVGNGFDIGRHFTPMSQNKYK